LQTRRIRTNNIDRHLSFTFTKTVSILDNLCIRATLSALVKSAASLQEAISLVDKLSKYVAKLSVMNDRCVSLGCGSVVVGRVLLTMMNL
jgi:hypothetical protein